MGDPHGSYLPLALASWVTGHYGPVHGSNYKVQTSKSFTYRDLADGRDERRGRRVPNAERNEPQVESRSGRDHGSARSAYSCS